MKKAKWLLTLALALCVALCAGVMVTASAEGALALGTLTAQNGATLNGSPSGGNVTVVTCAGGLAPHCYIQIDNYNKETITVKTTASTPAWTVVTLTQALSPWGELKAVGASVGAEETTITITAEDIAADVTDETCNLFVCWQNLTGDATITELTVGEVSYTAPSYVPPVEATDSVFEDYTYWSGSSNVTVAESSAETPMADGVDEGLAMITFSDTVGESYTDPYTEESATITYFAVPFVEGAVPDSWAKLYIKYKATSGIDSIQLHMNGVVLANNPGSEAAAAGNEAYICADIGGNAWNSSIYGSQDGYWLSITNVGANDLPKTALFFSVIFKAGAVAAEEKIEFAGMAFDSSRPVFATDATETTTAVGRQMNAVERFTLAKDGASTLISQIAGGPTDQFAEVLVNGYTPSDNNRFMKIVISADQDFIMGAYYSWSTVVSPYTNYKANVEYDVYADLKTITDSNFELWLFLDHNGGDNIAKTYTIKSMTFTDKALEAAPADNALTINYLAETVGYDDEKIEVFSDSEAQTAVAKNAAVTPGAKLYMRTKAREDDDGYLASKLVEFSVPARPEAETISPTASANAITITKEGYSFKLGDGEWTTTGVFTGLTAGTEYTITYRKDATATSFASAEKTVKVTTTAASGSDDGTEQPAAPTASAKKKGCGSAVMGGSVAFAVLMLALAGIIVLKKKGTAK